MRTNVLKREAPQDVIAMSVETRQSSSHSIGVFRTMHQTKLLNRRNYATFSQKKILLTSLRFTLQP